MTRQGNDAPTALTAGTWELGPKGVLIWVCNICGLLHRPIEGPIPRGRRVSRSTEPDSRQTPVDRRSVSGVTRETIEAQNEAAPDGAQTPYVQGLTDYEGVG
jgi:hypothetical protein